MRHPVHTIVFRGGTYVMAGSQPASCPSGTSWNAPVTFRPFPGETVVWTGEAFSTRDPPNQKKYWILEGEYNAATDTRSFIFDNARISGFHDFMRIKNVEFKNYSSYPAEGRQQQ